MGLLFWLPQPGHHLHPQLRHEHRELCFLWLHQPQGDFFQGNAPNLGSSVFSGAYIATVYYLAGTKGWASTFGGRPMALWSQPIEIRVTNFGIQTNRFGFTVTGTGGQAIVVDGSTSLADPIWIPLLTNTPSGGLLYFTDPRWTDYPGRFYRVRSQ